MNCMYLIKHVISIFFAFAEPTENASGKFCCLLNHNLTSVSDMSWVDGWGCDICTT